MAKKKKGKGGWQQFDNFEDFMSAVRENAAVNEDGEQAKSSGGEETAALDSFIIEEKVNAFVHGYQPCDEFTDGAIGFDDARLRELFKGYVCPLGDPMKLYMEHLKLAGFRMTVSVATGELTLFAVRRFEY